jgi:hypothetical protein
MTENDVAVVQKENNLKNIKLSEENPLKPKKFLFNFEEPIKNIDVDTDLIANRVSLKTYNFQLQSPHQNYYLHSFRQFFKDKMIFFKNPRKPYEVQDFINDEKNTQIIDDETKEEESSCIIPSRVLHSQRENFIYMSEKRLSIDFMSVMVR